MAASGLTFANCVRDGSPVSEYEAILENKWVTKRKGTTPSLEVGPWGAHAGSTVFNVNRALYDSIELGEPVRVGVRAGRLGLPWIRVEGP
jgi:lipoprotein-anchoring transpeptidase ErfK/SrfK